jgi:hypothetical protein
MQKKMLFKHLVLDHIHYVKHSRSVPFCGGESENIEVPGLAP